MNASTSAGKKLQETNEVVDIHENSIELRATGAAENSKDISGRPSFLTKFGDLTLQPSSVCALTWADNHRLFMCKVRAEVGGCPLGEFTDRGMFFLF